MQRCDPLGVTLGCIYNRVSVKRHGISCLPFKSLSGTAEAGGKEMALQGHFVAFRIKAERWIFIIEVL